MLPEHDRATIPGLLAANAADFPGRVAVRERRHGIWKEHTWPQVLEAAVHFAAGMAVLGFQEDDELLVAGDNRARLYFAMAGAAMLRGVPVPVYPDLRAQDLLRMPAACRARYAVAQDQEQVDKLLELRSACGHPQTIVYDDSRGLGAYSQPGLVAWDDVIAQGAARLQAQPMLRQALPASARAHHTAVLLHTCGTTGHPRAVRLTHAQVLAAVRSIAQAGHLGPREELVACQPIAWYGDFILSVGAAIALRLCVHIPERPDTLLHNLREAAPTSVFASPAFWTALRSHVEAGMRQSTPLKRALFGKFTDAAMEAERLRLAGGRASPGTRLLRRIGEWLIFAPLRDRLGLARAAQAWSLGGAIDPRTFLFFRAIGLDLRQMYGQLETAGAVAMQSARDAAHDSVGRALPGVEVRLDRNGEILVRAAQVFAGYADDEAATAAALEGGWLRTGDVGAWRPTGELCVLGRAADMVPNTDGGRSSLAAIERRLEAGRFIRHAAVLPAKDGLVALICIDHGPASQFARENGTPTASHAELARHPGVANAVAAEVRAVNFELPRSPSIASFCILPWAFDPDDGELTRMRKLRRAAIHERYAGVAESARRRATHAELQPRTPVPGTDPRPTVRIHTLLEA